jgi:transposase
MLSQEEHVEVMALAGRGWTISAIARHTGLNRRTVRAYIRDGRQPGQRRRWQPDVFAPFQRYVGQRLRDDAHVWATVLYDEVRELGYERSYQRFTAELRRRSLRPVCPECLSARSRVTTEIAHEPGEELQWDWVELPDAPWGGKAHLLQATLSHSTKFRGALAESEDEAHLAEAMDKILRRLRGSPRRWRIDRMSTAVEPKTGNLLPWFAAMARHFGVAVDVCPSYRARRKGKIEKTNHFSAQRWWRTAAVETLEQAQRDYDRFCVETGDARRRGNQTVAEIAAQEPLLPLPEQPYPAVLEVGRKVGDSSLVAWRGNRYSVLPGLEGASVLVRHRLGSDQLEIVSPFGITLARHLREPDGAGVIRRLDEHRSAQEEAVLAAFGTGRRCRHKVRRPLTPEALAEAARLRPPLCREVAVDLADYALFAEVAR